MRTFFWILTVLGSLMAAGVLVITVLLATGAPQQAAGAAIACAVAIIPYVLARAVEAIKGA
jgi:hypothetical protein